MPVKRFNDNTFVAFTDISGFKDIMKDEKHAFRVLDSFYQAGYNTIQSNKEDINGFFVSDCGILFVRNTNQSKENQIVSLLKALEDINRRLLQDDIMLTTSIAYGHFKYHQRLEFKGIEKNPIYGHAYVAAYLDHETNKPKIQPGQCRILSKSITNIDIDIDLDNNTNPENTILNKVIQKGSHYYFYWNVNDSNDIDSFNKSYNDSYKLKYQGMIESLKKYSNIHQSSSR